MSGTSLALIAAGAAAIAVLGLAPSPATTASWARSWRVAPWARRLQVRLRPARHPPIIELMSALAAELAAGQPTGQALAAAAAGLDPVPCPSALRAVRSGGLVADGLRQDATGQGAAALRTLAACWDVAEHSGAGLGLAVTRLAEGVRASASAQAQLAGEVAAVRASARLLAGLPVVGLALGHWIGAAPLSFLTGSAVGWAVLVAGVGLQLAGVHWLRRIVAQIRSDL